MNESEVLDAYLNAPRKRAALQRAVRCEPEPVESLQRAAVARYVKGTLTLAELALFAHDLAAVCPGPEGQRLYAGLASIDQCCVRKANIEARELLQGWLAN